MPSIRKQKMQKRSRQQRRREGPTVVEKQRLVAEDKEASTGKEVPVQWINRLEQGYGAFDNNNGGSLKKRMNKRSRQQRRRVVTTVADMEQSDAERQRLEAERQEAYDREAGFPSNSNPPPTSANEWGFGAFDNGGGSLKKRMNGGRKSTQSRAVSLKTAVKLLRNYYAKRN